MTGVVPSARRTATTGVALALAAVLGTGTTVLELAGSPPPWLVPVCLALASGAAAAELARRARRLGGRAGRPWAVLAVAAALLASGQALATARSGSRDLAAGGPEDLPMLVAVPLGIAAALLLMPPRRSRRVGSRVLLDGAVVTLAVAVLGHVLLGGVLGVATDAARGLITVGYPAVGAVLCGVGLVTVTAVAAPRRRAATWLLACYVCMAVVAVSGALGRTLGDTGSSVLTVLAWLGMLATAACAAAADAVPAADPGPVHRTLPLRGGVVAHVAAAAVLVVLAGSAATGRAPEPVEAAGGVLLVVLTSARTLLWAVDAHRLTRRLQRTEGWFRALVHSGDAATLVLDDAGRVASAEGAVAGQLGAEPADLLGRPLTDLLHEADRPPVAAAVREAAADHLPAVLRLRTGGATRDIEVVGAAAAGEAGSGDTGLVLHLRDVSERSATQRELERMAYTDSLTGLPNRARFMVALQAARARAAGGRRSCVLLLDLDGFKSVNDVAGHDAGDRLLVEVAHVLRDAAREGDLVARLGGDEFAIVVDADPDEAIALAERLVPLLARTHRFAGEPAAPGEAPVAGPPLRVSCSVGVAEIDPAGAPSDTMREADLALRAAKADGKNGVRASGQEIVSAMGRRSRLARDLPGALEADQLRVVYQPVVGWAEGRVLGVEALVRWDHPELGPIAPDEFIGLAEDEGLIVPLQRWVLGRATTDHARLVAGGRDLKLGVNVSALHVQAGCLTEDVARALARSGLPAGLLMIELTESVLLDDEQLLRACLAELSDLGCVISLDDFGRGYSSLAYLARLPVDVLKMDREFVSGVEHDARAAALVGSVVDLGRTLGMDVVAEGVETPAQAALLMDLGCRYLQGWLLGRPVPAEELAGVVDGFDPAVLVGAAVVP
ncbi:putative bifunctional diguanylate cyclase/phosphodiesterase [Blastococcus sp. SYSU D00820]